MTGFLGAYEQRHMDDRQRIETMMRYAETTFCRVRFLREYFGADSGEDCEHCDNCRARAQGVLAVSKAPSRAAANRQPNTPVEAFRRKLVSAKDNLFHIGDRVRHKRFGTGQITEIAGQNLDVDFGQAGHRRIRRDYVRKAS